MQNVNYCPQDEFDEELNINFKKIFMAIMSRRILILKVFLSVLLFFILLTFIMPKKYEVTADLYINKTNNSNMIEVNPYILDEAGGSLVSMGTDKAINNEIELMKSALVLDKVIRDNNIVYKKKFGFIPNKKEGEYVSAKGFYGKGKKLKIENTKNTNVITIKYTATKPEMAYGVVSSLITNYIELHKELNSEKSKSDKKIIEKEYYKAKADLNSKLNQSTGLPPSAMTGVGSLSALSAFSKSASSALGSLKSQYLKGQKSELAITEEQEKVSQLATKLEWARMVEEMSDSSKVLIIDEPKLPQPFEKKSPKLLFNIILGCLFGFIASIIALIYKEKTDKKLSYSMLTDDVIYNLNDDFSDLKLTLLSNQNKKFALVPFESVPSDVIIQLKEFNNTSVIEPDISKDFIKKIHDFSDIILFVEINKTDSKFYKQIKSMFDNLNKKIIKEVLI